jgi:hypothetical protein
MHHDTKAYRGMIENLHLLQTSAFGGSEWSASLSGHFTPGKLSQVATGCHEC